MNLLISWLDALLSADQRSSVVAFPVLILSETSTVSIVQWDLTIYMSLQINSNPPKKSFQAKMITQHSNSGASFEITDLVEYLVNVKSALDRNFNRMRRPQRVELKSSLDTFGLIDYEYTSQERKRRQVDSTYNKLRPDMPF